MLFLFVSIDIFVYLVVLVRKGVVDFFVVVFVYDFGFFFVEVIYDVFIGEGVFDEFLIVDGYGKVDGVRVVSVIVIICFGSFGFWFG